MLCEELECTQVHPLNKEDRNNSTSRILVYVHTNLPSFKEISGHYQREPNISYINGDDLDLIESVSILEVSNSSLMIWPGVVLDDDGNKDKIVAKSKYRRQLKEGFVFCSSKVILVNNCYIGRIIH